MNAPVPKRRWTGLESGLTQLEFAAKLRSSRSRAGDPSVSQDHLIRALISLG